jgi:hypothetical protein
LDPANGAGWLDTLARASASKDDAATDAALAAIARSDRVDIYWTTLVARLSRAAARPEMRSLTETELMITGVLAASIVPAYQSASNACKAERLERAEVVEVCRGVARAFMRGDTVITEMIGVAIAKRVWPEDSPRWQEAVEARRVIDYRSRLSAKMTLWHVWHAEQSLTLCAEMRREQDVLLAELIAAGKNPNPSRG